VYNTSSEDEDIMVLQNVGNYLKGFSSSGCDTTSLDKLFPTFQKNASPLSSRVQRHSKQCHIPDEQNPRLHSCENLITRNCLAIDKAKYPRTLESSCRHIYDIFLLQIKNKNQQRKKTKEEATFFGSMKTMKHKVTF
jgi:hypothetical protein